MEEPENKRELVAVMRRLADFAIERRLYGTKGDGILWTRPRRGRLADLMR
jgi:hypothetical protein